MQVHKNMIRSIWNQRDGIQAVLDLAKTKALTKLSEGIQLAFITKSLIFINTI